MDHGPPCIEQRKIESTDAYFQDRISLSTDTEAALRMCNRRASLAVWTAIALRHIHAVVALAPPTEVTVKLFECPLHHRGCRLRCLVSFPLSLNSMLRGILLVSQH